MGKGLGGVNRVRRRTWPNPLHAHQTELRTETRQVIRVGSHHGMPSRAGAEHHGSVDYVLRAGEAAELARGARSQVVQGFDGDDGIGE